MSWYNALPTNYRIILPFCSSYEQSGGFTFREKAKKSLYSNVIFYALALAFLVAFIIFLSF